MVAQQTSISQFFFYLFPVYVYNDNQMKKKYLFHKAKLLSFFSNLYLLTIISILTLGFFFSCKSNMCSARLLNTASDLCVWWLGLWVSIITESFLKMVSIEIWWRGKDVVWQLEWRDAISKCINKMFAYPQCLTL